MPAVPSRHNPFEFGGELKASALIDREQELDLSDSGITVLRYDAEVYESLGAVIEEGGTDLRSAAVLARYGIAASTMHKMLKVLDSRGLVREEETIGSIRYRLEDPFFARWLRLVQASA